MPINIDEKLRNAYIQEEDPSEYIFAIKHIGTWEEWEDIVDANKSTIESWRRALEAKIKSSAISRILEASKGDNRDALQANKFLIDTPWVKEDTKRGRPSRSELQSEAKRILDSTSRIEDDLERIKHSSNY